MLPQSRNLIKGDVPATRLFFFLNQGAEIEQGYFFLILYGPEKTSQ